MTDFPAAPLKEGRQVVYRVLRNKGGMMMDFIIGRGRPCGIALGEREPEAVRIAAENLKKDMEKVFGEDIGALCAEPGGTAGIRIRTAGPEGEDADAVPEALRTQEGGLKKEAYELRVSEGCLFITGSDRRGTVYGIYELSEMIGVSPWYFWADVPVKAKEEFRLPEDFVKCDSPSVEYRGIFINDEEELEDWVKNRMGEDTIGVKTYEKVFELLLRLRANYIWPAMHVNSFNAKRENGALAERMGIVVGTSHCDMLMRSNNREWKPWLAKKGYTDAEYDYSESGRNREILKEYWRESVEQNRDFEVCYTLGMRGIHDSGFETRALRGLAGEELQAAKIRLLQQVISDQRELLRTTLGRDTMTTFVPYKEVLPLYDGGLEVPEDVTLVWANDNYGYIRRYPSERERARKGGNGIYYHNSYWAPPGMSYVFLCSIPLAHTANELRKAWAEGIRRLWVINTGAIKPLEQEITFFLRLAWEVGKENALTEDVDAFVEDWIDKSFTGGIGKKTAELLNDFSQLTNARKPEMMDKDTFSQTAYGDEAAARIHAYERLFREGNGIYESLPEEEKPAFFQLALMRIHAAYFTNLSFYYGDRSTLANRQGKAGAAAFYAGKTRKLEDARRRMLVYYNERMLEGKWKGILNPEGFPPPRTAMMPVCTPPLTAGETGMTVTLWNDADRLSFVRPGVKWLEIGSRGAEEIRYELKAPKWLKLSEYGGRTGTEVRIGAEPADVNENRSGVVTVSCPETGEVREIFVETVRVEEQAESTGKNRVPTEDGGLVAVEADSAASPDFKRIARLGRGAGSLMEAAERRGRQEPVPLTYSFRLLTEGQFLLEIHRFPSLNSTGRIRIDVSVDGGPRFTVESGSRDEHQGTWRENVRDNVDLLYLRLPRLEAGIHTLSFYAVDKYFAFSRFLIYTEKRKPNRFAGAAERLGGSSDVRLPVEFDAEQFAKDFYGGIVLFPRPVEYARPELETDGLCAADLIRQDEDWAAPVEPAHYLGEGQSLFEESEGSIPIDAAAALSDTPFAFAEGGRWAYCGSESYGRSGLAMYVERQECGEKETNARTENRESGAHSLNYLIRTCGGEYTLWLLSKFDQREEAFFGVGLDGEVLPDGKLYGRGCLWRYEAEQIYRWVPLCRLAMEAGEHRLTLYSPAAGLRFDRVFLTAGEELPPMDSGWEA